MGDVDHRFDDLPVQASAGIQILNQRHVELDQVDFKAAENVQRGIAAAEIVEPELVSHFPQAAQLGLKALGGGGDIPLGNLHDKAVPGDIFIHLIAEIKGFDFFRNIPVIEILGGKVHRDRQQGEAGFRAERNFPADLLHHI